MKTWIVLTGVWALASRLQAQEIVVDHTCIDETDKVIPQEWLDKSRTLKVLFGHQSVGGNLLEGLDALAKADSKRYACERSSDVEPGWFDSNNGIGDFFVGENEDPKGKMEHFKKALGKDGFGKHVSVAMMKFCFVDFGETDAKALFEKYRDTLEALESEFPKVRFVWWTAPLADGENEKRHDFNKRVREHCKAKGKTLFDLADIESHTPKGDEILKDGVPALWEKYTEDGGHLNERARARAARAFWWLLARIQGWKGK